MNESPTVQLRPLLEHIDAARALVFEAIESDEPEPALSFDDLRRHLRRALRMLGDDAISQLCKDMRALAKRFECDFPSAPLPVTTPRLACNVLSERQVNQGKTT